MFDFNEDAAVDEELSAADGSIWCDMTKTAYFEFSKLVEVRCSPLGGLGVFVKNGCTVDPHTWISPYLGIEVPPCECSEKDRTYGLRVGTLVIDAETSDHNSSFGHIVNSSHAMLPPPYNKPNTEYGCVRVHYGDGTSRVKGGVYSSCKLSAGTELLADYHWLVVGERCTLGGTTYILKPDDCEQCVCWLF